MLTVCAWTATGAAAMASRTAAMHATTRLWEPPWGATAMFLLLRCMLLCDLEVMNGVRSEGHKACNDQQ